MIRSRPRVDPKSIRKASDFRPAYRESVKVAGPRIGTPQGYRVSGTTCSDFETFFEHLAPQQATDKMLHAKKTRAYRIVSGQGFILLEKNGEQRMARLITGDEVVIEPGLVFQLLTTSNQPLEFFVTQSSKYEDKLQIVEASTTTLLTPPDLSSYTRDELLESREERRSRVSKAAEQQLQIAARRKDTSVPSLADIQGPLLSEDQQKTAVNLRPQMGRDLRGAEG